VWPVQFLCAFLLSRHACDSFILWSGDGGCMLLGTLLMLSFYARASSSLRKGWLRWGFLVIGAAAFADAFATWWAARPAQVRSCRVCAQKLYRSLFPSIRSLRVGA